MTRSIVPNWPTLYQKDKSGSVKEWTVSVIEVGDGTALIMKRHGLVGGKIQGDGRPVTKGKNVGRANETSPVVQAIFEAESAFKKQKDKGYVEDPSGESNVLLPMKALTFQKAGHRVKYPAFVQPKLNGVRCLVRRRLPGEEVEFLSSGGKSYTATLQHLVPYFKAVFTVYPTDVWDGEVYVHGWTLQEIVSAVKAFDPAMSPRLQFWAYDLAVTGMPFIHKMGRIITTIKEIIVPNYPGGEFFPIVTTKKVDSPEEVKLYHDAFVDAGYEGVMIKNSAGTYEIGKRSHEIQKYKEFIDHEFEIIGGRPAEGTQAGCVIFRVRGQAIDRNGDKHGVVEFDVVPRGSLWLRRKWMEVLDSQLIGKKLTVRYHDLSEDGVPVPNPVGIIIRDYE